MPSHNYHTPLSGGTNLKSAYNTALGEIDAAIGTLGFHGASTGYSVTSGTAGNNAAIATWNQRSISGFEVDAGSIVSIASDQMTPIAGKYFLWVRGFYNESSASNHRLRLYNATQASAVYNGMSLLNQAHQIWATLMVPFTANGTDAYQIDHYTELFHTAGLGFPMNLGTNENYLDILLIRLGDSP
jgi:hypothetical protein